MKRRGFLEEAALGLAEAVSADRVFAAAVLLASALFLRDARWDVGAMFLAGAAVSRSSLKTRWLVFLLMAGVARGLDSDLPVREWSDIDKMAPVYTAGPRYLRVALLLVAGGVGMRWLWFPALGVLLAIGALLVRGEGIRASWPLAWTVVSLGLAAVGAARRPHTGLALAFASLVVAAAWNTATSGWPAPSATVLFSRAAGVVTEAAFVTWPVLAGFAGAPMRAHPERSDPVRLLVLLQRAPGLVLSGVAAFAVLYGGPSFPLAGPNVVYAASLPALALVGLGASLLVALAAGGRSGFGCLAALFWLSAAVVLAWDAMPRVDDVGYVVAQTAFAALVPFLFARRMSETAPRWVVSFGLPVLLALLVVQSGVRSGFDWYSDACGRGSKWLWLVVAPGAFFAATCVASSPRRIVLVATTVGVVSWLAFVAGGARVTRYQLTTTVGVWFLGGVYVVIARRARSLTAVPLDHPSVSEMRPAAPTFGHGP